MILDKITESVYNFCAFDGCVGMTQPDTLIVHPITLIFLFDQLYKKHGLMPGTTTDNQIKIMDATLKVYRSIDVKEDEFILSFQNMNS